MKTQTSRWTWLWLLIGFLLLPFVAYQSIIPLAAWLAPIFLLRFVRTAPRAKTALPLIFAAYALSILVDMRGGTGTLFDVAVGLAVLPLLRGILYALPYAADRLIGPRLGAWPRLLVFPCTAVCVDWLMSLSRVTGTFGSPAYSQDGDLALLQLVSITGMWGLTFLIMAAASTVNAAWENGFTGRHTYRLLIPCVAALLVVFGYGFARLSAPMPAAPTVVAATITLDPAVADRANQGVDWATFNQSTDAQRAAARPQFQATVNQMLARTETALQDGAKLVSWQEGAGIVLEEDKPQTIAQAASLARRYDAYVQVSLAVLTRTSSWHFIRNQAILIDPTGSVVWTYNKTYPLFGAESLTTIAGPGIVPVADTSYGRLSTAICVDSAFPELIRQAGQNHADILIVPSNEPVPPWDASDHTQVTERAIENGVSLVRPTGHGLSLITDPEGRIVASQEYSPSHGILLGRVPTHGVATIYRQIGDAFAYLCALGLVSLAGWAFLGRRQPSAVARPRAA